MKTFRQFFSESALDTAPRVPVAKHMILSKQLTPEMRKQKGSKEEVRIEDLGLPRVSKDQNVELMSRHKSRKLEHTKIEDVPLSKIKYTQPHVNVGKVRFFMKNDPHDPPEVHKYPDGTYVSHDHHRLIAAHMRGDKTTKARVTSWEKDGEGYIQAD